LTVSSRTPEGLPARCPICGNSFLLEPSFPAGDVPCPSCGHLLWWFHERFVQFAGPITPGSRLREDLKVDSLEIVELVMELEAELRIKIPDNEYERIRTVGDLLRYVRNLRPDV
jgi:acyl carrier protein